MDEIVSIYCVGIWFYNLININYEYIFFYVSVYLLV